MEQAAQVRLMHHAVHGRAQQRRLQGVSHTAGQADDIEQRPSHGQPPRAYPGDARGVGGRVQAVNHPGQQQNDEQVRHDGSMTRYLSAAQVAITRQSNGLRSTGLAEMRADLGRRPCGLQMGNWTHVSNLLIGPPERKPQAQKVLPLCQ